jgi:hypothetical protein
MRYFDPSGENNYGNSTISTESRQVYMTKILLQKINCLDRSLANFSVVPEGQHVFNFQNPAVKDCPELPPNLVGPIRVWMDTPPMEKLELLYPNLAPGDFF